MKPSTKNFILFSILFTFITSIFFYGILILQDSAYFGLVPYNLNRGQEILQGFSPYERRLDSIFVLLGIFYILIMTYVQKTFYKSFTGKQSIVRISIFWYGVVFFFNAMLAFLLFEDLFGSCFLLFLRISGSCHPTFSNISNNFPLIAWGLLLINFVLYYLSWNKENMKKEEVFQ